MIVMMEIDHFVQRVGRQPFDGRMERLQSQKLRILRRMIGARSAHNVADDAEVTATVTGPVCGHRSRCHVTAAGQEDHAPNC